MNECTFFIEILAPKGLAGIEKYISHCQMKLSAFESGFNQKVILRSMRDEDRLEWAMDSSTEDTMQANGAFFLDSEASKKLIESLSHVLSISGFPHKWKLDDEEGNFKFEGQFKWRKGMGKYV